MKIGRKPSLAWLCDQLISFLKGREIVASSDLLLGRISCSTGKDSAVLVIAGRRIDIQGDEAVIDGIRRIQIPAACKKIECTVSRGILEVWVDGTIAEQMPR